MIHINSLKGALWGGIILGLLFVAFRILVRIKVFGRLYADDALVFFAWLLLLISTVLGQTSKDALYQNVKVSSGRLYPPPTEFAHQTEQNLRKFAAVLFFFYTGLWSIKLAFLIFFKRLGHNVKNQDVVWWIVFAITVASFFACVGNMDYRCMASSFQYIQSKEQAMLVMSVAADLFSAHCANNNRQVKFAEATFRANMAIDVATDILSLISLSKGNGFFLLISSPVVLVPVNMLWKVRLSIVRNVLWAGSSLLQSSS